ncbi:MAG: Ig-like domain-containing protein, partial [Flammeovirgaceae bacterium]|nr:Ig-like domain-containing protein [Flammeovirgaceae bacterium]
MIFSKCKILLVLQLSLVFNCFAQLSDDFNRDSLESGLVIWNQGLSSGMTGEFLIESNELRAVFDNGSGTRAAYISTEIHPDLQAYTLKWNGKIKLDFSNLSSSLVSKNLGTYYLMSDKLNLLDNPYGFFLEFKLVPAEDSLTCELMFESSEGKTELQFENQEIKFKAQEYLSFEVTRNPDGDWKVWINDHYLGRTNFPLLEIVNAAGLQIQYSSGSRENKFFMDDFSLDYNPFFDSLSVSSPNELELFCKSAIDSPSVFILENYFLNDSINPEMVSFDNEVPEKIKLHFSSEFIPDYLNTLSIKEIKDENGYEISEERPQNLIFTYSQPDLSPPEIFEISGIEKNRIIINFNEAVVVDTSRLQDIFKILETENQIIQFQVDSLDSKKLKLSFQYEFKVGNSYTLKVSQLADAEGNIQTGQDANFVFSDNFPPGLEKIEVLSGKSLKLIFSEPLDELQA